MTKRNKEIKARPDENVSGIAQAGVGQKKVNKSRIIVQSLGAPKTVNEIYMKDIDERHQLSSDALQTGINRSNVGGDEVMKPSDYQNPPFVAVVRKIEA